MDYCSSKPIRCRVQALRADTSRRGLGIHPRLVWAWPLAIFIGEIRNRTYNPSHIKLGHPVLYPYSNKKLYSFPASVDFVASGMPINSQKPTLRGKKIQTSQPQKTNNLEIKVQKPGDLEKSLEIYRADQKELKPGVHQNKEPESEWLWLSSSNEYSSFSTVLTTWTKHI